MDYNNNGNYNGYYGQDGSSDLSHAFAGVMNGVYLYMFLGLMVTAATALFASMSETFVITLITTPGLFVGLLIGELVLVFALSAFIRKMSYAMCVTFFILYSIVNGLTLSVIFLVYTDASIASVFLTAAITFGAMSAYGYFTKKDLTSIGNLCFMGLIGIIIAGIVNIFFRSDMFSFLIAVIGLIVFIGLTAYDTQKIKQRLSEETDSQMIQKITIWGALALYLDFINIFLKLLRLLGRRK